LRKDSDIQISFLYKVYAAIGRAGEACTLFALWDYTRELAITKS